MASPLARESEFLNAFLPLSILPQKSQEAVALVASLSDSERDDFLRRADSHHVVVRAFRTICEQARVNGNQKLFDWAQQTIRAEEERIATALTYLDEVCKELEA